MYLHFHTHYTHRDQVTSTSGQLARHGIPEGNIVILHIWSFCDVISILCPSRSSVGRASDSQPAPGSSPGSRRFGARYIEPPDGDGLRSGSGRSQLKKSVSGADRVRLCGHVKTFASKFCRLPGMSRSEGRGQGLRYKLCLLRAGSVLINPSIQKVRTKFIKKHN